MHDQSSPAALALAVKDAAILYHGAAGIQWLRCIVEDRSKLVDFIADGSRQFVVEVIPQEAAGQVIRVAKRFALVAVAGKLATHYGLTGWPEGEAINAARKCFAAWLEAFGGTGNREERAILEHVRAFFEAYGNSRLEEMYPEHEQRIINRAGFYRIGSDSFREYLVLPTVFQKELCQGYDTKTVAKVLRAAGWIVPDNHGKSTQNQTLPGMGQTRCYVFTGRMWKDENTSTLKHGVEGVAGVEACIHAGLSATPEKIKGVAGVANPLPNLPLLHLTTPPKNQGVARETLPLQASTPATPSTPPKRQDVTARGENWITGEI